MLNRWTLYALSLCWASTVSHLNDGIIALRLRSVLSLEDSWLLFPSICRYLLLLNSYTGWMAVLLSVSLKLPYNTGFVWSSFGTCQLLSTSLELWVRELLDLSARERVGLIFTECSRPVTCSLRIKTAFLLLLFELIQGLIWVCFFFLQTLKSVPGIFVVLFEISCIEMISKMVFLERFWLLYSLRSGRMVRVWRDCGWLFLPLRVCGDFKVQ